MIVAARDITVPTRLVTKPALAVSMRRWSLLMDIAPRTIPTIPQIKPTGESEPPRIPTHIETVPNIEDCGRGACEDNYQQALQKLRGVQACGGFAKEWRIPVCKLHA